MKIDRDNPPKEVWHITRAHVRVGKGPTLLTPAVWSFGTMPGSQIHSFTVKGRKGTYWTTECFATEADAKAWGLRYARQELRYGSAKWAARREKLMAAAKACE